jgi:hypothetical protein
MSRIATLMTILLAASLQMFGERSVKAQTQPDYGAVEQSMPADYASPEQEGMPAEQEAPPPPIPPYVDGPAVQTSGGGYCFEGPHPVDSRVEPGSTWDATQGRHIHGYPPFDLRLFSFQNGCYYFIGDPTDFGYAGDSYSYYGAHPILATYGGGWCFMIGPHRHFWRPWSPLFVTVGSWYYWEGPYDPFFWTYWPFYHFYYRSHYPHYYSHGAFFRGHAVAPRITTVPRPPRNFGAWHGANTYRGSPGGPRGFGPHSPAPVAPGPRGGFAPHNFSAPSPSYRGGGAPFGGGSRGGGHFGGGSRGGGHFRR